MGNAVACQAKRSTWRGKIRDARGPDHDTSEKYLHWLLVDNHNNAKKAFEEADEQT